MVRGFTSSGICDIASEANDLENQFFRYVRGAGMDLTQSELIAEILGNYEPYEVSRLTTHHVVAQWLADFEKWNFRIRAKHLHGMKIWTKYLVLCQMSTKMVPDCLEALCYSQFADSLIALNNTWACDDDDPKPSDPDC